MDITTAMSVDGMAEVFRSSQPGDLIVEQAIDAIHDGTQVKAKWKYANYPTERALRVRAGCALSEAPVES
ncbi:hypothetical protein NED98_17170 [Sphingomonas sp. MMSM20]|uniref:hypothetical protein n=1 Tax=Sphingomonas lycopersici TaxID=2951807 RepID=UPI002238686E|nr:hypothetical protein [Sphingomonas lycopersici]MCW6531981.1 hypothetical protein [Sphingomonas lycopersici]